MCILSQVNFYALKFHTMLLKSIHLTLPKLAIFAVLLLAFSCTSSSQKMINLQIGTPSPLYFGYSGLHLYAISAQHSAEEIQIELTDENPAVDLYKVYGDIAIFLSNNLEAYREHNLQTFPVFGNPAHKKLFKEVYFPNQGFQVAGYLTVAEVKKVSDFLNAHDLTDKTAVVTYYRKLSEEVKEELEILLDDRVIEELHAYLEPLTKFYAAAAAAGQAVVMIVNG